MYKEGGMTASARLVVQMTPEEKAVLERRARNAGLSTSEFVRRRVRDDDDIEENREEIEALLAVIESSAPRILKSLDSTLETAHTMMESLDGITGRQAP
jgi:uncharacterized protein (DUF1778 family)